VSKHPTKSTYIVKNTDGIRRPTTEVGDLESDVG